MAKAHGVFQSEIDQATHSLIDDEDLLDEEERARRLRLKKNSALLCPLLLVLGLCVSLAVLIILSHRNAQERFIAHVNGYREALEANASAVGGQAELAGLSEASAGHELNSGAVTAADTAPAGVDSSVASSEEVGAQDSQLLAQTAWQRWVAQQARKGMMAPDRSNGQPKLSPDVPPVAAANQVQTLKRAVLGSGTATPQAAALSSASPSSASSSAPQQLQPAQPPPLSSSSSSDNDDTALAAASASSSDDGSPAEPEEQVINTVVLAPPEMRHLHQGAVDETPASILVDSDLEEPSQRVSPNDGGEAPLASSGQDASASDSAPALIEVDGGLAENDDSDDSSVDENIVRRVEEMRLDSADDSVSPPDPDAHNVDDYDETRAPIFDENFIGGASESSGSEAGSSASASSTASSAADTVSASASGSSSGSASQASASVSASASTSPTVDPQPGARLQPVIWIAPFFSGSGLGTEAISNVLALRRFHARFPVQIIHHGDTRNEQFINGLSPALRKTLLRMENHYQDPHLSIIICHSSPWAFHDYCKEDFGSHYRVARTMFETDSVPGEWIGTLQSMDELWLPTLFHAKIFASAGIRSDRVFVVPESVNAQERFNPMTVVGFFPLPHFKHSQFKFLSVFKWEERKGWRVLLEAFAREFSFEDNVALYILTQPFTEATTEEKVQQLILNFTESLNVSHPLPPIWVLPFHVAYQDVPRIYASVDAFVLPTHGEGWGRPIVEAMAMQLPVIATNWSGPTAYLDETNGFPLPIDGLEDASVFHKSHRWAKPSLFALRRLMRYVSNRDNALEVKRLARKARSDMLLKFSRTHLGNIIAFRLDDIVSRVGYPKAQASLGNGVPLDWDGIDSDLPLETEPLSAGDESRFTLLSREVIEQPLGLRQNV